MKKTIFTLMLFVSACSNISQVGVLGNVNNSERNKACMDMTQFKVLQVVEDGHALAFECNDGDYCYNNTVVLLTPQNGIDYYDDMIVGLPDEKCAIQDGVYRYETKNKICCRHHGSWRINSRKRNALICGLESVR